MPSVDENALLTDKQRADIFGYGGLNSCIPRRSSWYVDWKESQFSKVLVVFAEKS
jgi:hypothetical protein